MEAQKFPQTDITLHFNLRKNPNERPSRVYAVIRIYGKQIKFSLQSKIYAYQWRKKKECAAVDANFSVSDNRNARILNSEIFKVKNQFSQLIEYICNQEDCDAENVLPNFFENMRKKRRNNRNVINDLYLWLREKSGNTSESTDDVWNDSQKQAIPTINLFGDFIEERENVRVLSYDDLNNELFRDFALWLKNKLSGYKSESMKQRYRYIVNLFDYAASVGKLDEQINLNKLEISKIREYLKLLPKAKQSEDSNDKIYLTPTEIKKLRELTFDSSARGKKDEQIRDVFIFQMFTGQRYSDVNGKKIKTIITDDGEERWELKQKKTKTIVSIPLSPESKEILVKYNYQLPKTDNKTANIRLKELGRLSGMTATVSEGKKTRGKNEVYDCQRADLIGTHTARRTFVSIALLANMSLEKIRAITGHSSDDMVDIYNCITSSDVNSKDMERVFGAVSTGESAVVGDSSSKIMTTNTSDNTPRFKQHIEFNPQVEKLKAENSRQAERLNYYEMGMTKADVDELEDEIIMDNALYVRCSDDDEDAVLKLNGKSYRKMFPYIYGDDIESLQEDFEE